MILVDTSVWIDHFRENNPALRRVLERGTVVCHPFVIGELACGNLRRRSEVLALLEKLPSVSVAQPAEVLALLEQRELMGRGLGWVDVHLIASALISDVALWSLDRSLRSAVHAVALRDTELL